MLSVKNISVRYGDTSVLHDINLNVNQGEIVGILGPSGIGKSTLLKTIAGLVTPDTGSITLDGVDITRTHAHLRKIGMVFQDNQLFPHLNVEKNIAYGLRKGVSRAQRLVRVKQMLELVGLEGFEKRKVTALSGGEAKRVALARSLANNPSMLLLDEPLTGLDSQLHDQLTQDLAELLKQSEQSVMLVTHNIVEAQQLCDRIINLGDS